MWNESNVLTIIALNKCNKKPKSVSLLVDHHLKLTWKDRKVFDQKYILLGVKYWRKEQEIAFFCIFWLQPNFLAQNSTIQYNNTHTVPFRHMMLLFMQCNEKCIFFSFFFKNIFSSTIHFFFPCVFHILEDPRTEIITPPSHKYFTWLANHEMFNHKTVIKIFFIFSNNKMLTEELRQKKKKKAGKNGKKPNWFVDRGLTAVTVKHGSLALNQCQPPTKSLCSLDEKQSRRTPS